MPLLIIALGGGLTLAQATPYPDNFKISYSKLTHNTATVNWKDLHDHLENGGFDIDYARFSDIVSADGQHRINASRYAFYSSTAWAINIGLNPRVLRPNTRYNFTLTFYSGPRPNRRSVDAHFTTAAAPNAGHLSNANVSNIGNTSVVLNWDDSSPADVLQYIVYANWKIKTSFTSTRASGWRISGLRPDTNYVIVIEKYNSAHQSVDYLTLPSFRTLASTPTPTPTFTPTPTATPVLGNMLGSYPDNYKIRISNIKWNSVELNWKLFRDHFKDIATTPYVDIGPVRATDGSHQAVGSRYARTTNYVLQKKLKPSTEYSVTFTVQSHFPTDPRNVVYGSVKAIFRTADPPEHNATLSNIRVSNISHNSAQISWDDRSGCENATFYAPSYFIYVNWVLQTSSIAKTKTLVHLEPDTDYEVAIAKICLLRQNPVDHVLVSPSFRTLPLPSSQQAPPPVDSPTPEPQLIEELEPQMAQAEAQDADADPVPIIPGSLGARQPTHNSVTVYWWQLVDPENSDTIAYYLFLEPTAGGQTIEKMVSLDSAPSAPQLTVSGLEADSEYRAWIEVNDKDCKSLRTGDIADQYGCIPHRSASEPVRYTKSKQHADANLDQHIGRSPAASGCGHSNAVTDGYTLANRRCAHYGKGI